MEIKFSLKEQIIMLLTKIVSKLHFNLGFLFKFYFIIDKKVNKFVV